MFPGSKLLVNRCSGRYRIMVGYKSKINALKLEASVGQLAGQSAARPVPSYHHKLCSVRYQTSFQQCM